MKKFICILLFLFATTLHAQTYPTPNGYVNDFAGVMSPEMKSQLETLLTNFHAKTGDEIAVAVMKNLGGSDIETYAVQLFQRWGVGEKGKDNGILFLVATEDRALRLEVGYGLEHIITDGTAGNIRDKYMVPYLKNNDWDSGISQGVLAAVTLIAQDAGVSMDDLMAGVSVPRTSTPPASDGVPGPVAIIFLILFIFLFFKSRFFRGLILGMFLGNMLSGGRRGSYHSGGFGGGLSGGGFGGGMSGGGGASGRF